VDWSGELRLLLDKPKRRRLVVGYALQELSQVLLERTSEDERSFEPVPADEISGLDELRVELEWVDGFSREMSVGQRCN
jgi:hypothetical protein